jgi:hypothetical protein
MLDKNRFADVVKKIKEYGIIKIERAQLELHGMLEQFEETLKIAEAVNSYPNVDGKLTELSFLCLNPYEQHYSYGRCYIRDLPAMRLEFENCDRCSLNFSAANLKVQGRKYPIHIKEDTISVHLIDSETYNRHRLRYRGEDVGKMKIDYPICVDHSGPALEIYPIYLEILLETFHAKGWRECAIDGNYDQKLLARISPLSKKPIEEQVHNFLGKAESAILTITDPKLKKKTLEEVIEMLNVNSRRR